MTDNRWKVLAAILAAAPCATTAQTLLTERTLSFSAALEAATAAMEQCRKDGYRVTGASPHTIENSLRKAWTSLTYRTASGEFGKRITSSPTGAGALHLDKITTAEGALPIMAGKDLVGSIGVSGAPGGDKDALCSQAGIDRIGKGLVAN